MGDMDAHCYVHSLSERQYSKIWSGKLNLQLERALKGWLMILGGYGVPRQIREERTNFTDIVAFTDGWWPEVANSKELPQTGFVVYDKSYTKPIYAMAKISQKEMDRWLPRKTQIVLVEMFAAVQLVASCGDKMRRKKVLLFVDSEAAQGALIKGGSSKADISELGLIFWRLVQEYEILIYIDRVPTDGNISDGCSRGSRELANMLGWHEIQMADCLEWALGWLGPGR